MTFKAFDLERLLSDWEQTVDFNFAESGVHPVPLKELLNFADADLDEFLESEFKHFIMTLDPTTLL